MDLEIPSSKDIVHTHTNTEREREPVVCLSWLRRKLSVAARCWKIVLYTVRMSGRDWVSHPANSSSFIPTYLKTRSGYIVQSKHTHTVYCIEVVESVSTVRLKYPFFFLLSCYFFYLEEHSPGGYTTMQCCFSIIIGRRKAASLVCPVEWK